mmetsp:Transcript_47888/g.126956  ORF Transcript_47888/g.126956 Transcript_47888/m.126956 type:complete len:96 (-) Transcript_47888:14-301(-)
MLICPGQRGQWGEGRGLGKQFFTAVIASLNMSSPGIVRRILMTPASVWPAEWMLVVLDLLLEFQVFLMHSKVVPLICKALYFCSDEPTIVGNSDA